VSYLSACKIEKLERALPILLRPGVTAEISIYMMVRSMRVVSRISPFTREEGAGP
jgi:hypothetical protein